MAGGVCGEDKGLSNEVLSRKVSAMISNEPLVTVVTIVYNGDKYLAECIESVLAQSYRNFEYVIVNNCSTDKTLHIAREYADKNDCIRVVCNDRHVGVMENYNIGFRSLSSESKYCKMVAADDWITPDCLSKMVGLMETYPTIAIVGAYQLKDDEVQWKGLSPKIEKISGREASRISLIDDLSIFGPPTSNLYRSDLVRKHDPFFSVLEPHGDICANYEYLQHQDFGFIHETLSIERVHHDRVSTKVGDLYMDAVAEVDYASKYGPTYLNKIEQDAILKRALERYYRRLGGAALKMKGKEFWRYQTSRMREIGYPISWPKVVREAIKEVIREMKSPKVGYQKLKRVLREKCSEFGRAHSR